MKFNFSAAFLTIVLLFFAVSVQAQEEKNFEIELVLNEASIVRTAKDIPATVRITNKSREILYTDSLGRVELKFSKCLTENDCGLIKNDFLAHAEIPRRKLFENDSVEFQINLAAAKWFLSDHDAGKIGSNVSFEEVPVKNLFFTAAVKMLTGYRNIANAKSIDKDKNKNPQKRPRYRTIISNVITVNFN